ncbi:cytochrome P450 [Ephemerocybe angulata]|uniref:Cytochrome P450 n=1 Tax=Ephemerocybe angulata TaxID=980116 RepID=A0A8H6I3V5_9AGAR|nr:cytochrome P450 [Tulosesus angulatus]
MSPFYEELVEPLRTLEPSRLALGAFFTLAAGSAAYLVVSRLVLHPLAHIPGPKLAALTDWYVTYYDLWKNGKMVDQLSLLHEQYGPVVRIGPNKLDFCDLKAYDQIYRDVRFPKEDWFYDAFLQKRWSLFGCTDITDAKRRANIIRPLFSRKKVLHLEHVIQEVVDRFILTLAQNSKARAVTNIYRGFSSITMEVMTTYCFATKFHIPEYPNFSHPAMLGFQESNYTMCLMRHFPLLRHIIFRMPVWLTPPGALGRKVFVQALNQQASEILADPSLLNKSEHETIYHYLLNPENGEEIPQPGLREHAVSMVAAGTETVGNTCTMATFHILNDKRIKDKLTAELEEACPDVESHMPLEKLEKLPYLTAVIQEALRLSHGVVTPLPRIVTAPTQIGGVLVPENTVVGMSHAFVHLNADIFPNPTKFDPQRWLEKDSADLLNHLVPFSKGQRSCVGVNLAWAELYLILGNLFRKVNMELFDTSERDLKYRALLTPRYHGDVRAKIDKVRGTQNLRDII